MDVVRIVLVVLAALVALTAVPGGIALATGLEGERYPVEMLRHTPFRSWLVPGLVLAGVVGGSAASAAVATVLSAVVGGWLSVAAGLALAGQIVGEIVLLPHRRPAVIELVYLAVAAAMTTLGVVLLAA